MSKFILGVLALFVTGTVAMAGSGSEKRMARFNQDFNRTGQLEQCIQLSRLDHTRVLDDQNILFELGSDYYLNTLPRKCGDLGYERSFSYSTPQNILCDVDTITVLETPRDGTPGATCRLGQFEKLEKIDKGAGE